MVNKGSDREDALLTPELLATLDDASLLARLAVAGSRAGRHRSVCRGYGGEFEQYRDYVPGDDAKYVDWKLFARQERLCTKVFREETDMRVAIVLDASGSMGYQGRRAACSKYRYAAMLAACLVHLATRAGDSAGVFVQGGGDVWRCVSHEANWSLGRLLGELTARAPGGKAEWDRALASAEDYLRGRGMLVLVSDFHEQEGVLERRLKELTRHQCDCLVFQVLDEDELLLPFEGCLRYVDSETGKEVSATGADIGDAYRADMRSFVRQVQASGLSSQSSVLLASTHDDLGSLLSEFLRHREEHGVRC